MSDDKPKVGQGFARRVTKDNLDEFTNVLGQPSDRSTSGASNTNGNDGGDGSTDGDQDEDSDGNPFSGGTPIKLDLPFEPAKRPPSGKGGGTAPVGSEPEAGKRTSNRIFAIQVRPHDNGEILLSKTAVDTDPDFFGYPFEGETTPKKSSNPPYPQRVPDPKVQIVVIGTDGEILFADDEWDLNTVYYSNKSEIRITVPRDVPRLVPDFSILIMREVVDSDLDYEMEFHTPDSPEFDRYVAACDQKMPSGGKSKARKFGWL